MSSSPALEHSSPSATTPSSPALRAPHDHYANFTSSTPNSVGKSHKPLHVVLPGGPVTPPIQAGEAATLTPPPRSPAAGDAARAHHPPDGTSSDKSSETAVPAPGGGGGGAPALSRKESYKAQRQHYRREKKRATSALLHSIEEPSVVVLADWLKVRGSLKSWTKLWCVLKPGLLLLYKSSKAKSNHWVGTVILTSCQVIERPSKKDGFCFKLYHPLEQSIWAPRGPHNESIGAVVQPLPTAHLIFRAPSQAAGHCWLDGLELALKCSNAMLRCSRSRSGVASSVAVTDTVDAAAPQVSHEDLEKHFHDHELEGLGLTDSESSVSGAAMADATPPDAQRRRSDALRHLHHFYMEDTEDVVGPSGELVEEIAEENKSLLWFLVKQVRPGMDLSKVVLPTFILEPRSFLDKLSDNYYHADILASVCGYDDPYQRFKTVLKWYLSGLYRKPKGLKKPYNPVRGELFRCFWYHPDTDTRTYYIAEQVSHHPPISAFYVSNRKDGFIIEGSLLARSKFYGNSTSAILEGSARIILVNRGGEIYITSAPYAHCKGLVVGTLSMELGGKVHVSCPTTGYYAEIDFKLKSFLGGADQTNAISGRVKRGKETVATLEGYWDGRIDIKDKRSGEESVLLDCSVLRDQRLRRSVVRPDRMQEFESARLWAGVSRAIAAEDQTAATEEKTLVEQAQRERARQMVVWTPQLFHKDERLMQVEGVVDQGYRYNHLNAEAWSEEEVVEYEEEFRVKVAHTRRSDETPGTPVPPLALPRQPAAPSDSDSHDDVTRRSKHYSRNLRKTLNAIDSSLREQSHAVERLRSAVEVLGQERRPAQRLPQAGRSHSWDLFAGFVLALVLQAVLNWLFFRKD